MLLLLLGCLLGVIDDLNEDGEWYSETTLHLSVTQWTNIDPHLILYCFLPVSDELWRGYRK